MAATKPFSFLILLLLIISIVGKIVIKPAAFQITSQGGDGVSDDHEISFEILYKGFKSQQTLNFPTNINQCSMKDDKYWGNDQAGNMYCGFDSGKTTLISQAQELTIDNSDSYNSIHWNVVQHDALASNDQFTVTISSSSWKLSSALCTPYEIRIAVEFTPQKKNTNCFSANLNLSPGIPLGPALLRKALGIAQENLGAQFSAGWESCSEWTQPANSYVLYANVEAVDIIYPTISSIVSVCTSSRIATKDGYGNAVFPYNIAVNTLPKWITWDEESYIANPSIDDIGDHSFTLGVFGSCGAKDLNINIKVQPEVVYPTQKFEVYACTSANILINDSNNNTVLPSSPGSSLAWIISDNKTYIATPTTKEVGIYNTTLPVKSSCGTKSVSVQIAVKTQKPYQNVSYFVKACSRVKIQVKNYFGIVVPPSTLKNDLKTWISYDNESYIASPLAKDIGIYNQNLSMFSHCGSRYITATIAVTESVDFIVNKMIISVNNTDNASFYLLDITPSDKVVVCENYTNYLNKLLDWVSIAKEGKISVTPTSIMPGRYTLYGQCSDKCGNSKPSVIEITVKGAEKTANLTNDAQFVIFTYVTLGLFAFLF